MFNSIVFEIQVQLKKKIWITQNFDKLFRLIEFSCLSFKRNNISMFMGVNNHDVGYKTDIYVTA